MNLKKKKKKWKIKNIFILRIKKCLPSYSEMNT